MKSTFSQLVKMLSLTFIVSLALSLIMSSASATTGSGTPEDPYVSEPSYGASSFEAADKVVATTRLKAKNNHDIYLNVQAQPMTRKQIKPGTCVTKPVGTKFWNEVIDPSTGKRKFNKMRVQAGDNVFCQDRSGTLRKKSCGNKAIFKGKPAPKLRLKGKIVIKDYLTWTASQTQKVTKSGSAFVLVKTETCQAGATVDNEVFVFQKFSVRFKSRTMLEAQVEGGRQVEITAKNDQTVEGTLKQKILIGIKGQVTAWCQTTTPPPPPPPVVVPKPVLLDVTQVNDLEVNWQTQICAEYNVAQGRSALLKFAPFFGSIVDGPSSFTVSGHDTKCVTLKAPSEVPTGDAQAGIPAGKDRVTYTLTDTVSGDSATPMSTDYRVYENAVHPG